jgi:hypothetical protein
MPGDCAGGSDPLSDDEDATSPNPEYPVTPPLPADELLTDGDDADRRLPDTAMASTELDRSNNEMEGGTNSEL